MPFPADDSSRTPGNSSEMLSPFANGSKSSSRSSPRLSRSASRFSGNRSSNARNAASYLFACLKTSTDSWVRMYVIADLIYTTWC